MCAKVRSRENIGFSWSVLFTIDSLFFARFTIPTFFTPKKSKHMFENVMTPPAVAPYEQKLVEGFNSGNASVADEVFHKDCIIHINGNAQRDLSVDAFKQMVSGLLAAFPDLHFTIDDQFAEGNKYSTRWTATGTNTGPFGDLPATGKEIKIEGLIIDLVVDGKVARRWELWDQMAMMQQLGLA